MLKIVAKCRSCGGEVAYAENVDYASVLQAQADLLSLERQEIMDTIVNQHWAPPDFQLRAKAHEHPIPKEIQATSVIRRCGCGCSFLYSAKDFYIVDTP